MPSYTVTLYLANGATATVRHRANNDGEMFRTLESELAKPKCSLSSVEDSAILIVKNPDVNVIAYAIDRLEP